MQDKINITQYNEENLPHGLWIKYHANGDLFYKGNYIDGELYGYLEVYYTNRGLTVKRYHAK